MVTLVAAAVSLVVMPFFLWGGTIVAHYTGSTGWYVGSLSTAWTVAAAVTAIGTLATDVRTTSAVSWAAIGFVAVGALVGGLNS